jgi:hypothetical protein
MWSIRGQNDANEALTDEWRHAYVIEVAYRSSWSSPLRLLRRRANLLLRNLGVLVASPESVGDLRRNSTLGRVSVDVFDHLDFGQREIPEASSGGAWRSLAALISLPRSSASLRKGTNSFMQASRSAGAAKLSSSGLAEELLPQTLAASSAVVTQPEMRCAICCLHRCEDPLSRRRHFVGIADEQIPCGPECRMLAPLRHADGSRECLFIGEHRK